MSPRELKRPYAKLKAVELRTKFAKETNQYLGILAKLNSELDTRSSRDGVQVRREVRPLIERIQANINGALQNFGSAKVVV